MNESLGHAEQERYSRHLLIPEIGETGQLRLKAASVLLIGSGALGSPAATYLAAAGVGRIAIVDPDVVELSNLHRQILHHDGWIGKPKVMSAAARLREINPHIRVETHAVRFTPENALDFARGHDVIVDGSDNFPTRFLTNDTAFLLKIPLVYGAIHRFEGQVAVFAPHIGGPCYRCMLPALPAAGSVPSCADAGVLGVLPGVIGSLQAMETIKLILGIGEVPIGRITSYDGLRSSFRSITLGKDPRCRLCGENPEITSVRNAETSASASCAIADTEISASELREILAAGFDGVLLDVREPQEHARANIDGARLVPLGTLENHLNEWPKEIPVIIHCKAGTRSARALEIMAAHGFTNLRHLKGGIDAWLAADR
ncbi:MAG: molybdopterin-synthase adenylyltransferase MoeB [Verrucomicrobiota bacterium]